jgi:hypothetical protein
MIRLSVRTQLEMYEHRNALVFQIIGPGIESVSYDVMVFKGPNGEELIVSSPDPFRTRDDALAAVRLMLTTVLQTLLDFRDQIPPSTSDVSLVEALQTLADIDTDAAEDLIGRFGGAGLMSLNADWIGVSALILGQLAAGDRACSARQAAQQ